MNTNLADQDTPPSDPGTVVPGRVPPGMATPGTTQPRSSPRGTTQPGTTQPGTTQPGTGAPATVGAHGVGDEEALAAAQITGMRARIDEIDATVIALWQERAALSRRVGATRVASGGTRLVLAREREILDRFRDALGADGTQLGLLLLRSGRGPL